MATDLLEQLDAYLVPEPQRITPGNGVLRPGTTMVITAPGEAEEDDVFAAGELAASLKSEHGIEAATVTHADPTAPSIQMRRRQGPGLEAEGYRLIVGPTGITLEGNDAAGLFWGTQTILQSFREGPSGLEAPCMTVEDWPDLTYRAIHYDTKHHQDTYEYVEALIRTLVRYKVNTLVWEWEDKFAYERHPEIGAPGAFTKEQMQALTAFGRQRHLQIVPLVQGLGHVSYLLKHPQHTHLREVPDSAWELCPLKDGSYELLFDLWDEAMAATPGSEFLHIGSDETYELGRGEACGCRRKAEAIGKDGLMQIFIRRAVAHVESRGRRAMSWGGRFQPGGKHQPPKKMIFVDSSDIDYLRAAQEAGYDVLVYSPNPGIEPLFLGYLPWVQHSRWREDPRRVRRGSFRDTAESISAAGQAGAALGSITTSWDDSGLHNQAWMPRFVCAAEYSWSSGGPEVDVWFDRYAREYFGRESRDMRELFRLLQDGAQFYYDTFERRVWHWGDIGKIHVPDFPRQELEYHPFWCRRYAQLLHCAEGERQRIARALSIIDGNLSRSVKHRYDFEVFRTCAELMRHNTDLILMLGRLEEEIGAAGGLRFSDRRQALKHLEQAQGLIEEHLADRRAVFENLVGVWERTRVPKGYSTPGKPFLFAPDRARHFANRTPDMRYLILDEELLDLEGYLERLRAYTAAERGVQGSSGDALRN